MAINKKLIHFKTKDNFDKEVANGNILDTSIIFIQDTQQIWTHGQFYNCSDQDLSEFLTAEDLTDINSAIASLESNKLSKTEASSTYASNSTVSRKQDTLYSGTNIKTINGESVLGSGNITIDTSVLDSTGTSTERPMSQKATTEAIEAEVDRAIEVEAALEARIEAHEATTTQAAQDASEANAYAQQAYSRSTEAINTANTAKNAVSTLEGLANTDTAQTTLAATVTQIEQNTTDVDTLKTMHVFMTEAEFEALAIKDPDKIYMLYEE